MEKLVFDCTDLRKYILNKLVYLKYKEELSDGIKELLMKEIKRKWYRYCTCELCKSQREYVLATYGEMI